MKRSLFCLLSVLVAIFVQAVCAHSTSAQDPPVQYELTLFGETETTIAYNMNNAGTVVGKFRDVDGTENAFLWRPETGLVNLNHLAVVPTGWRLGSARGINESGQIAGNAVEIANASHYVAYRYDPSTGIAELMETISGENHRCGYYDCINESGDVLYFTNNQEDHHVLVDTVADGIFEVVLANTSATANAINDNRQIVGSGPPGYRITLGATPGDSHQIDDFQSSDGLTGIEGINNSGVFASFALRKVKGRNTPKAIRYTNSIEHLGPNGSSSRGINSATLTSWGDVVGSTESYRGGGFLFMDEHGYMELDELVIGSTADLGIWLSADSFCFVNDINDRDSSGFGSICGFLSFPDDTNLAFVLTPIVPGQTPGITVTPTNGLVTTEGGGTDSFTVVLDTQPTADVTFDLSSNNTAEGTVSPASLTFTSGDWNTPKEVTVSGVDDANPLEPDYVDVDYLIVTAAAVSSDADYNGLDADDVTVTNQDDDSPPGGGTETYSSGDTPTNIPDRGMTDSTIDVSDNYQIVDLTVTLAISHPRPSDLDVYLVGPNFEVVQLFNFTGDNAVSVFDGISTDGTWTLEVYDTRKKKTGTINSWSMTIDY